MRSRRSGAPPPPQARPTLLCPVCGAPVRPPLPCDFDRPAEASPAHGDYDAMREGLMTHAEHVLVVARWALHNASTQSPAALERFHPVALAGWGRAQPLFPLKG